jgi:hypothetical protein
MRQRGRSGRKGKDSGPCQLFTPCAVEQTTCQLYCFDRMLSQSSTIVSAYCCVLRCLAPVDGRCTTVSLHPWLKWVASFHLPWILLSSLRLPSLSLCHLDLVCNEA